MRHLVNNREQSINFAVYTYDTSTSTVVVLVNFSEETAAKKTQVHRAACSVCCVVHPVVCVWCVPTTNPTDRTGTERWTDTSMNLKVHQAGRWTDEREPKSNKKRKENLFSTKKSQVYPGHSSQRIQILVVFAI